MGPWCHKMAILFYKKLYFLFFCSKSGTPCTYPITSPAFLLRKAFFLFIKKSKNKILTFFLPNPSNKKIKKRLCDHICLIITPYFLQKIRKIVGAVSDISINMHIRMEAIL